jgi:lipopolysaccharide transport system ATP-binding protein
LAKARFATRWSAPRRVDPLAEPGAHGERADRGVGALRDVIHGDGDKWSIIGRNGAGKSTLLKISADYRTDCRPATLNGRVASLLEVGTGFHPELTAVKHYRNGAIRG